MCKPKLILHAILELKIFVLPVLDISLEYGYLQLFAVVLYTLKHKK